MVSTRIFALVSVIVAGACHLVYAAPVPPSTVALEERNCRLMGCLFAEPDPEPTLTSTSVAPTSSLAPPQVDDSVAEIIEILDIISAMESVSEEDAARSPELFSEPVSISQNSPNDTTIQHSNNIQYSRSSLDILSTTPYDIGKSTPCIVVPSSHHSLVDHLVLFLLCVSDLNLVNTSLTLILSSSMIVLSPYVGAQVRR
ncbi:hypothetical protein A0H81_07068 [Grifola frondosa]|uniref:Uncharacterized protein n=1 Tax=Grifola frondosa TaxID=5627 RepID=A0A1C7MCY4_GRIFR|nr:hypothetical protein A0H81_07068 [Grifola frondosa]